MIPIVFGIDKSYVLQVFTVIHSILKNSEADFHFIVLSKDNFEKDSEELVSILEKLYSNFVFEVRRVEEEAFDNAKINHGRLSQACYFRLLISKLVKEYDTCIYLDSDLLVNGDMQQLFQVDLEDCYLAGVRDCHLSMQNSFYVSKHQIKMNLPTTEDYVNSGVLVMNLKKMREDNMVSQFLLQAEQVNPYEDQDVLNICCYGAKKILPLKYNVFHHYCGAAMKQLFDGPYVRDEFEFDWDNPFILHTAEIYKPWVNKRYKRSDQWWSLAEIYKNSKFYQSIFQNCKEAGDDLREMKRIFEVCSQGKKVVLWGFTDQGREVCDIFFRRNIVPYGFCDNDKKKQGESYKGISVLEPDFMTEEEVIWIITCKNAYREVQRQLVDAGIEADHIFHFAYNSRNKKEYLVTDPRYYEEEVKIIALCENDKVTMGDEEFLSYISELITKADIRDGMYRYLYRKYRFDLWLKA